MVLGASRAGVFARVCRGDRAGGGAGGSARGGPEPRGDASPRGARRLIGLGPGEGPADGAGDAEHGERALEGRGEDDLVDTTGPENAALVADHGPADVAGTLEDVGEGREAGAGAVTQRDEEPRADVTAWTR